VRDDEHEAELERLALVAHKDEAREAVVLGEQRSRPVQDVAVLHLVRRCPYRLGAFDRVHKERLRCPRQGLGGVERRNEDELARVDERDRRVLAGRGVAHGAGEKGVLGAEGRPGEEQAGQEGGRGGVRVVVGGGWGGVEAEGEADERVALAVSLRRFVELCLEYAQRARPLLASSSRAAVVIGREWRLVVVGGGREGLAGPAVPGEVARPCREAHLERAGEVRDEGELEARFISAGGDESQEIERVARLTASPSSAAGTSSPGTLASAAPRRRASRARGGGPRPRPSTMRRAGWRRAGPS